MKLEVRGREFDIDFVNNYCHEKWNELVELSSKLSEGTDEAIEKARAMEPKEGVAYLRKENDARRAQVKQIADMRDDILRELIESNDMTFDSAWWNRKTAPNDINEFIVECIKKDDTKSSVKKK